MDTPAQSLQSAALLSAMESTLSVEDIVALARGFVSDNPDCVPLVAVTTQVLLTLWPRLKTMSHGTYLEPMTNELDTNVIGLREALPSTQYFIEFVRWTLLPSVYIFYTKNTCNLLPLVSSPDVQQALALASREQGDTFAPVSSEKIEHANKVCCQVVAGVWIVLDQLMVIPSTRSEALRLVETGLVQAVATLMGRN